MTVYQTTVINGKYLCVSPHLCLNPTDKENPPPGVLPPEARALWDATYANAHTYYDGAWDLPQMAAWRAVKMRYPHGVGNWSGPVTRNPTAPPKKAVKIPDPGKQIILGRVLEYVVMQDPPHFDVYRFPDDESAPKLVWSKSKKMLLILPTTKMPDKLDPDMTGLEDMAHLYKQWSWGQGARGQAPLAVKDHSVKPLGMADTIVYRSGKGTDVRDDPVGVQEYIHQFGDGVVAHQGPNAKSPDAIMFRGGDLDVVMAGIVN